MTLQLADRSVRKPRGVVEDILVRVDKLIIPVDFVILDVDDDVEVLLILGRPFLNTAGALIDVKEGKMTLRVGDEQVVFTLPNAMKHTLDRDDSLYYTDTTDVIISDCVQEVLSLNPLDEYLEELEDEEPEELNLPPPSDDLKQSKEKVICKNTKGKGKEESMLRKIWREVRGKKKKGRNSHCKTPHEKKVKFLPLFDHDEYEVHSLMSLNLPGNNNAQKMTGGGLKLVEPP